MKIKNLSELIWKIYNEGRSKATDQTLRENDIKQLVQLGYNGFLRKYYYESKKLDDYGEADTSIISQLLSTREFQLSETNNVGMRYADMDDFDLYRLPKNSHLTNVYPIGGSCGSDEIGTITQVNAGEEKFYLKPGYEDYMFYVLKGRRLETYHLPPCVSKLGVETTYNTTDIDVSMDIAYDISQEVFSLLFKEKQFPIKILDNPYDPNAVELKRRLQEQEAQP